MVQSDSSGRVLEQRVADHFRRAGYSVRQNAVLEGRSGATHEVDVLATRMDPLTSFTVVVECKSWSAPVGKDAVAKLDLVVKDLALNKGILVAAAGSEPGARQAARSLGIELWGPDELAAQVGAVAMATPPPAETASGWAITLDPDRATDRLERAARGLRAMVGRERVEARGLIWLPWHAMRIAVSRREGRVRRTLRSRRIWNLYDALTGRIARSTDWEDIPQLDEVVIDDPVLPQLIRARDIRDEIDHAVLRHDEVVTDSARERHALRLHDLGIDLPVEELTIEHVSLAHQPLYVAVLRRRDAERAVVIDAHTGERADQLAEILTAQIGVVRRALSSS